MKIKTPGRICLFGEHQDYLGLPVIAMAISKFSSLSGVARNDAKVVIRKPDINNIEEFSLNDIKYDSKQDIFKSGFNICKRFGFKFSRGFDVTVKSDIPIKAGTSSSSSLLVSWIHFLTRNADNAKNISKQAIGQLAYEAEVIELDSPGGMMDQFSTSIGGLIYLESHPKLQIDKIDRDLGKFVLGDSRQHKDTIRILSRCKNERLAILEKINRKDSKMNFNLISEPDLKRFNLSKREKQLMVGTIRNRDILIQAKNELKKEKIDKSYFGELLNEHHSILDKILNISTPRIELMLKSVLQVGAYGGKINGSGGGGCMIAYCPENSSETKRAIEKAGGKAHIINIAAGTQEDKKENIV